ncbi:MAG: hypothetical protein EP338_12605 [Bacteroidetes bacterium]|nr:MAG: hypothetical protein EP338_12605 [Bacteroidota bacterium]
MKRYLPFLLVLLLGSCGEEKKEDQLILEGFKDRLSYALGADHARSISESGDPNFQKYDLNSIVQGFEAGLGNEQAFDEACQKSLKGLFGAQGNEFNEKEVKSGSACIGKLSSMFFTESWKKKNAWDRFDIKILVAGFEAGLKKSDSLIPRTEQASIIQNFIADMNKLNGTAMMERASKMEGAEQTASGLVLIPIVRGNGPKPEASDDVLAHYILINSLGDTLQSSFEMVEQYNQPLTAFSLLNVVPGWQEGLPLMQKGGKYHLYVPFNMAYGDQGMYNPNTGRFDIQPYESLKFYIELLDCGKAGSLTK